MPSLALSHLVSQIRTLCFTTSSSFPEAFILINLLFPQTLPGIVLLINKKCRGDKLSGFFNAEVNLSFFNIVFLLLL